MTCEQLGTCPPTCTNPPCETDPTIEVPGIEPTEPPDITDIPVPPTLVVPTPVLVEQPALVQQPVETVPNPPVEDIYCAAASTGQGPVSLSPGGSAGTELLPPGYDVITTVGVGCNGNVLDITLNIPDNYGDIRAFMQWPGGQSALPTETTESAQCGGVFTTQIRSQQLVSGGRPLEELEAIESRQAILEPTDAERVVSTGDYSVQLLDPGTASATVQLSSPTFDVPAPAHPNLAILGTPLLVRFQSAFAGRTRITMPYAVPEHIDPRSVSLYVRVGDQWRYLDSYFDSEKGIAWANVEDIALFLDNGEALFAVMGITCTNCQEITFERIYDGGSRKAVFLVHGFTTDRLRWQSFIDDLVHTSSEWQVWLVSYPLTMRSNDIATELSSLIEQQAAEFDKASFIAHSMGGIIAQKALLHGREAEFTWPRKIMDVIMAGQPGLGSPSADVYGRLFGTLVNLKSAALVFNQRSPMLGEAVEGVQVQRSPGAEYFIIAGRQSYPFTYDLFQVANAYLPNDGVLSIYSARTIDWDQITDTCEHYFEVPRTHTDLLDDWLPRRVMQRVLFRNDAREHPERAIAGYNKYVRVLDDDCQPGTIVVVGKPLSEAQTPGVLGCKCGDGVCGEDETAESCPQDCVAGYRYTYLCRVLPWLIGPLIALLVLLTAAYVFSAVKRHERGPAAFWITVIAALALLLLIGHYLFCGFTMPLAILVLAFVLALLGMTLGHLHRERSGPRKYYSENARALEELLRKLR